MPAPQETETSRKRWLIENIVSLMLALLIVFAIRSSVIEAFKIPSGSMIPTLLVGDHIFVNKFEYGLKVPFSDFLTGHPIDIVHRSPPRRGDIIVFKYPKDERVYFIKRVIGVPGDTIEVRNKTLFINKVPVRLTPVTGPAAARIFKSFDDPKYTSANLNIYEEHLPTQGGTGKDEVDHDIMLDKTSFTGDSFGPVTVPPKSLFVMGDNRDFSNDSRFWGYVPYRNVEGKARVIWLSLWVNFSDGQFIFRPHRTGMVLH